METALALVHSRFSTNTFPSWDRAHPYRYIAHNGEINTLRGNSNWMHAREARFEAELFGEDIAQDQPDHQPERQRLGMFDNTLELLYLAGRSLPHAMMMMIPEPWSGHQSMDDDKRAFYQYHSCLMEPWDGPAVDRVHRRQADRRGARPQRPAPVALLRHQGRPRDHGLRGRRARRAARERGAEGPAAAGPHVPRRHRAGPHHRRRGDQAQHLLAAPVPPVARRAPGPPRRPARRARAAGPGPGDAAAAPDRVRLHVRGPAHRADADGARRRRGRRLDGQRHAAGGAVVEAAAAVRLLQAAVRAGDEPADRLHPRGTDHLRRDAPRLRGQPAEPAAVGLPAPRAQGADPDERGVREDPPHGPAGTAGRRAADPVPRDARREGPGEVDGRAAPDGAAHDRGGRGQRAGPERPRREQGVRADPGAAGRRGPAPLPDPRGPAHAGEPRARDRRGARGASLLAADRLRRERDQPVPGVRDARPHDPGRHADERRPQDRLQELRQGRVQGRGQGHVQDGHLVAAELPRRAGVRGARPAAGRHRRVLHLDAVARRRHRHRRDRAGSADAAPRGVPGAPARAARAAGRRPVPVARGRRVPPVQPGVHPPAAEGGAHRQLRDVQVVRAADQRPGDEPVHAARPARVQGRRAGAARGGGVRRDDHEALQDGRDVATARSARKRTRRWRSR